jgi:hypothetical protein
LTIETPRPAAAANTRKEVEMDPRDELRTFLRPASVAAAGIMASLVIYLGLVEVLKAVNRPFRGFAAAAGGSLQPLRLAAFGIAAAVVLVILILRHRLFAVDPMQERRSALARLQKASLVVLVLGEVPAILGLGLFLIGGNAVDFYILLFASLALTFIDFPRRAVWEEWLKG